ncbi:hypothetical protein L210DRAFT_3651334 [Boletus edulis BED1]|uniref:HMG box domain-containing protein n=1 Tax=Boletus edulis BED1 TaxID=1328754 RepID=A0AAD4G8N9_BOLED|nr:hypothetical protein L210DRAFT_3651334 [Boletus edulis BED1]
MPAIREHDILQYNLDDDDGMPPLVDNPNPPMTFTFFTDMTPITALSADPTIPFETVWENPVPAPASPPEFAELPETQVKFQSPADRASHGKKRDASYIPRPPNAFILFRSSFIRSQQVPEKVEGNHSTLSKIIGKYWKTLPREEREVWEAKALFAQAEHRKRYPDWRFRPGANALAKVKVKDGPQASNRKRTTGQAGRKVKGDPANKKAKSGDERCTVIADLLVEGKTGMDLEDAVRRWEDSTGRGVNSACKDVTGTGKEDGDEQREVAVANEVETQGKVTSTTNTEVPAIIDDPESIRANRYTPPPTRAQTPDGSHDDRFRIPLTAMFKRSLSAPAGQSSLNQISSHHRHNSFDSVFANVSYDIAESPQSACILSLNGDQTEDFSHAVSADTVGCLSPLVLPSVLREGVPARWNDPYNLLETSIGLPPSLDCPGLAYGLHTPTVSPVEDQSFTGYNFCATSADFDKGLPPSYTRDTQNAYCAPKNWAECAALQEQMPIFINEYAGTTNFYDWCTPHYGAYVDGTNGSYHFSGDTDQFGNDYIRVQAGDCLPAVAY